MFRFSPFARREPGFFQTPARPLQRALNGLARSTSHSPATARGDGQERGFGKSGSFLPFRASAGGRLANRLRSLTSGARVSIHTGLDAQSVRGLATSATEISATGYHFFEECLAAGAMLALALALLFGVLNLG